MKIALSGKMKSGKNTVADIICSLLPQYKQFAFADDLKHLAKYYFGMEKESENGREFLQRLGGLGRFADKNIWVDRCLHNINREENVIVTDVRFRNEADQLKKKGFIVIRILAYDVDRKLRGSLKEEDISETDLDNCKFDYTITNNSDLKDLKCHVKEFMEALYNDTKRNG